MSIKEGYELIPMSDITDEARQIALEWMNGFDEWMKSDIKEKQKLASDIMNYHRKQTEWIDVKKQKPDPDQEVLVVLDYREWDRERRVETARVHHSEQQIRYGGPNALTGSGTLTGTYFSIPAIVHPDVVTHWMPKPPLPKNS